MVDVCAVERLIQHPLQPNPSEWAMDSRDALRDMNMLSDDAQRHISNIMNHNGVFAQHNDAVVALLKRGLKQLHDVTFAGLNSRADNIGNEDGGVVVRTGSVFIVHGHDSAMKAEVARVLEQQGLNDVILSEQPANGMTIIEKLEYYAKQAAFALVLYSRDDTTDTGARARQNVVFEHGLFVGCLGRLNVIAIKNGDVEGYSDIAGVEYIHYEQADWKYKLVDALKVAGFDVSKDRIKG